MRFLNLILWLALASSVFGQGRAYVRTNNTSLPVGPTLSEPMYINTGDQLRHRTTATTQSGRLDLSGQFVRYYITSPIPTGSLDVIGYTNVTLTATILDATGGVVQIITTPSLPLGRYETKFLRYQANNSNYLDIISHDYLYVTSAPSAASGVSAPVTVSNQTIISSGAVQVAGVTVNDPTQFGYTGGTSTPSHVKLWAGGVLATGTASGANLDLYVGGDGVAAVRGGSGLIATTNSGVVTIALPDLIAASDQFLRSDGSTVFWSTDRYPLPNVGTNYQTWTSIGAVQYWVVSNGVSNIVVYAWGGGGGYGLNILQAPGGYAEAWCPVLAGETIAVVVASSGHYGSSIPAGSGWPGGGTNSASTYSFGGGFSGTYRNGTNWNDLAAEYLCIAAGGGAAGLTVGIAGGGGGVSGGDSSIATGGKGGTQTAGGTGWAGQTNQFAGSRFYGGGGLGANLHCGGAGYFGGGCGSNNAAYYAGGGGSGFVGTNALYGVTIRAQAGQANPPGIDNPYYVAGRGQPSGSLTLVASQVTIRW